MDRHIPHVLDVFTSSPGARRRLWAAPPTPHYKESGCPDQQQQSPGSDSAVSVGSNSSDEDERNISKYFDYLDHDDLLADPAGLDIGEGDSGSQQRKKSKRDGSEGETECKTIIKKETSGSQKNNKSNKKSDIIVVEDSRKGVERKSRKGEFERDIRHIERHLSMKKTIRKKIMRDLQQAFVENPDDFRQDPKYMSKEKKNNIDINNLTFSKNRLSKSDHNFLDMLKDDQTYTKERKGFRALVDFRKGKQTQSSGGEDTDKQSSKNSDQKTKKETKCNGPKVPSSEEVDEKIRDDDSGHGSPSREPHPAPARRSRSKDDLLEEAPAAGSKKPSLWERITGKTGKPKTKNH